MKKLRFRVEVRSTEGHVPMGIDAPLIRAPLAGLSGEPVAQDFILVLVPKVTQAELRRAAELLRDDKLVAFPTETVYGLGANALSATAVAKIYEAKGRPRTSPLIVHVGSPEGAREVVSVFPPAALELIERFWPGPLTLVLPKQSLVPDLVTAGLPTVGVRMPAHPIALALLREAGLPLAAPSANRFTQVSPTTAEHVRQSLGDRVDMILDGGPCTVGIESTVLSLASAEAAILRPGGVSRADIEEIIGPVDLVDTAEAGSHASPGLHPKHYSPRTNLLLSETGEVPKAGKGVYLRIARDPLSQCIVRQMPENARDYAAQLYGVLHEVDEEGFDWISAEMPSASVEWEAVLDRLRRAATS